MLSQRRFVAIRGSHPARSTLPGRNPLQKLVNSPYFRLRVGDYRLILDTQEDVLRILVLNVEHRESTYNRQSEPKGRLFNYPVRVFRVEIP